MPDENTQGFAVTSEPFQGKARIKVGPDGRILIPAALRKAAGLLPGETVFVELKDEEIVLATYPARIRKVQKLVKQFDTGTGSVVDELIADRRAEAERE